jgi:transcriptional regulator with XRE-family HTH domain
VAIDARVHPATISALERGIRVSPETLARIAGALGTTVEALRS